MENEDLENRIISLEMKISYLEDFMNQIQEVAVEQTKTITKLEAENKAMASKLRDMSELLEGDIPNRRPPHY